MAATATQVRQERLERYLIDGKAAGCPPDQMRNFVRAGIVLQGRQLAASAAARECDRPCDHPEGEPCHDGCGPTRIGYGGARGGGKSHWGIAQIFCDDAARFPGFKGLYLRKVGKAGREAVQDLRRDVLHSTPHDYKVQEGILVRRDNGSRLILGHFQTEKDIDNYLGLQYDAALIEEATQLTERKVRDIATCVRTAKPGWRPRIYLTTNPGNIGHAWFKRVFIEPVRLGQHGRTRFIQATVRDNRFVNAGYRTELESLTGWQRRAWLDGDWDIAAGQFFTNFRRELVVEPSIGVVPRHWRVWLALDYGFTHYTVCYLMAKDGDGTVHVIAEHAARRTTPDRHAEAIKAMCGRHGVVVNQRLLIVAGGDVFQAQRDGGSVADDYARHGLKLTKANMDRIDGAAEFTRRIADPDNGQPGTLRIGQSCARLLECLPALVHDPNRPEDVLKVDTDEDGQGGDDPYDACRYGLMVEPYQFPSNLPRRPASQIF